MLSEGIVAGMNTTTSTASSTASAQDRRGWWQLWTRWAPYAALVWAFGYAVMASAWMVTGSGFPMGTNDPGAQMSLLGGVPADIGAVIFAVAALTAVVVGLRMLVPDSRFGRSWLIGFGAALSAVLLFVIPDMRVLAVLGYLPMIIVKAPFDATIRADLADALIIQHAHQAAAVVGGFLWAAATLVYARRTAGTCVRCGRGEHRRRWTTPDAAARWARWPVYVAAGVPVVYAATRWIWVAGFALGIDEDVHAAATADGSIWAGAWLGSFALVGSVLTTGLIQRWGDVFPRWIPVLGGRSVPISLAVVPASIVAVMVTSAGLGFYKLAFSAAGSAGLDWDSWAALGPELLWPLWGVALGAATLAYYLRRRGGCADCGQSC